jgi:hypothetical protein
MMVVVDPCIRARARVRVGGCVRACVHIQGGADKSLSRPISRCRRTESRVSLERGVCLGLFMRRIASLFLLQRLKGSMSGNVRNFKNIEM